MLLVIVVMLDNNINFNSSSLADNFCIAFSNVVALFNSFIPTFVINTFSSLFTTLGISTFSGLPLLILVSWFVWVVYLHLLVDILAFIPKFFHKWLRRVDKYDE